MKRHTKPLLPAIPYIAVLIGMYALGSAWTAIGLYHVGMLAAVLASRGSNNPTHDTASGKPWLYLSTVIFASGGLIFYLVWPYLGQDTHAIGLRLDSYGIDHRNWPYFAVYFCIVNSLIEELFWRGVLRDGSKTLRANDLFFGGYHAMVIAAFTGLVWTIPVIITCAFAGWLWRMLRAMSGGLALPILTHFVADLGIVMAVHMRLFAC